MRIDVHGLFNGHGGWATHARNMCRALAGVHDVRAVAQDGPLRDDGAGPLGVPAGAPDPGADVALLLGPPELAPHLAGRARIAFHVWETTAVPDAHIRALAGMDEIWTPSRWGRDLLIAHGLAPARIKVTPEGVDADLFRPGPPAGGPFRFLFVGKWEKRKGIEDLLRVWADSFAPDAGAELIVHAHNPYLPGFRTEDAIAALGLPECAPIRAVAPCPAADLAARYRACDAFVLPTRGEGWGLPILEAMASGLPAIATAWSGPTEFMTQDCAIPLPPAGLVPVDDPVFYGGEEDRGLWAAPDHDALARAMLGLAADPGAARALGARARAAVEARWTWRHAGEIALRRLARFGN